MRKDAAMPVSVPHKKRYDFFFPDEVRADDWFGKGAGRVAEGRIRCFLKRNVSHSFSTSGALLSYRRMRAFLQLCSSRQARMSSLSPANRLSSSSDSCLPSSIDLTACSNLSSFLFIASDSPFIIYRIKFFLYTVYLSFLAIAALNVFNALTMCFRTALTLMPSSPAV